MNKLHKDILNKIGYSDDQIVKMEDFLHGLDWSEASLNKIKYEARVAFETVLYLENNPKARRVL